jgi:hypothetical protein
MFFSALKASARRLRSIEEHCKKIQEALGRIEGRQLQDLPVADIQGAEFRVFSQGGEDGIFQHLLRHIAVTRKIFVEFGVENYTEANTRFLLTNNNWAGLVIDGSAKNVLPANESVFGLEIEAPIDIIPLNVVDAITPSSYEANRDRVPFQNSHQRKVLSRRSFASPAMPLAHWLS